MKERNVILGITGASGAIYAQRLLEHLRGLGMSTHVVTSATARAVGAHEGCPVPKRRPAEGELGEVLVHQEGDLFASIASGSFRTRGMVIAPCSAGTMGRLAAGVADTLLLRAADVCLKERRPLILLLRETPLSLIHLENARRLTQAGALVMPASPGFYQKPSSIEELVDGVLARVLDHLGLEHQVGKRWDTLREPQASPAESE